MGDLREDLIRMASEWERTAQIEPRANPARVCRVTTLEECSSDLRSLLARHHAPSPRSGAGAGPQWIPGGAFCSCGEVEFLVPGTATVRTSTRGVALPTVHTPTECRSATWDEVSNLSDPVPAESATKARPADLVGALNDRVHSEGSGRAARADRATKGEEDGR